MSLGVQFISIFLAMVVIDLAWTLYTRSVTESRALKAASYSTLIVLLSGYTVISYTGEPVLLLAAALGAFVGTLLGMQPRSR